MIGPYEVFQKFYIKSHRGKDGTLTSNHGLPSNHELPSPLIALGKEMR